jgi:hypothetical protein
MKKLLIFLLIAAAVRSAAQPCIPNTSSLTFDGSSSYVSISPQTGLDITTTLTIEAWIQPTAFGFNSAQNSIVCKHGWSAGEGGFVLRCGGSGELSFNIGGVDTNNVNISWVEIISTAGVLALNTWTHVAGTYDGFELKCYVNGTLAGSTSFIGTIAPSASYPLALGRLADPVWGPDRYFAGSMDEVRIWNRALTEAELQAGMNNHIDPAGVTGLVSCWRMNEGANATLYDVAGTNNGGTIFCTWNNDIPFNAVPPVPVIMYNGGTLSSSAPVGNQWYADGALLAGATQNTFTPVINGIYTVEVTSPQGCSTLSAPFTVIDVGMAELNNELNISLLLNPLTENFLIEIKAGSTTGSASFILSDACGRKVMSKNILISPGVTTIRAAAGNLRNGIYFFSLQNDAGYLGRGRVIVN